MKNLLQKLFPKREKITLTNDDLVHANPELDEMLLARKGSLYLIRKVSKINLLNPKVTREYLCETTEEFLKDFYPFRELRNP